MMGSRRELRRRRALWPMAISLWSIVAAGPHAAPAEELSDALAAHLRGERFGIVTALMGLPLGVRNGLKMLFDSQMLDIAEPAADVRRDGTSVHAKLPNRRLVAAGCSRDHCLVYYERAGDVPSWRVALFHWTPTRTRFEWGGTAPGGLTTIDDVRSVVLAGAIKGPTIVW